MKKRFERKKNAPLPNHNLKRLTFKHARVRNFHRTQFSPRPRRELVKNSDFYSFLRPFSLISDENSASCNLLNKFRVFFPSLSTLQPSVRVVQTKITAENIQIKAIVASSLRWLLNYDSRRTCAQARTNLEPSAGNSFSYVLTRTAARSRTVYGNSLLSSSYRWLWMDLNLHPPQSSSFDQFTSDKSQPSQRCFALRFLSPIYRHVWKLFIIARWCAVSGEKLLCTLKRLMVQLGKLKQSEGTSESLMDQFISLPSCER